MGGEGTRPVNLIDRNPPDFIEDRVEFPPTKQARVGHRLVRQSGQQHLPHLDSVGQLAGGGVVVVSYPVQGFEVVEEVEDHILQCCQAQLGQVFHAELSHVVIEFYFVNHVVHHLHHVPHDGSGGLVFPSHLGICQFLRSGNLPFP